MAIFYQHNINQQTRLGIWHIEEPERFFLQHVPLKKEVTHPHKRLQHLAGRYLLTQLFDDFPLEEIVIADTKKPFLENERYHFSISHCGNYAAAIASSTTRVGIDIELEDEKVNRIAGKFLSSAERLWLDKLTQSTQLSETELHTMLWSCKEALFKWYGLGGVDFKEHLQWMGHLHEKDNHHELPFHFSKGGIYPVTITAQKTGLLVASWLSSNSLLKT